MEISCAPRIVGPQDGKAGSLGSIGVRFMIDGEDTHDGGFSLVEHPMPPRRVAAPLHKHTREDEYSFVLEGRMGALLGEEVVYAGTGDLVFKPRDQWHTFWNAGDEPCRILEIISPAGFEKFFDELVDLTSAGPLDPSGLPELGARYGLEANMESIPGLCERFGVTFGPERGAQRALARRAPSCLEDGEVPIVLPLGDLNPVVLPLLPLDLDVAVEDVLAEGAQHELRLGRELDGLAQLLR